MRSSSLSSMAFAESNRLMMQRYEEANSKFEESVKSSVVEVKLLEELNRSLNELNTKTPRESDRRAGELVAWKNSGMQSVAGKLGFEGPHGISAGMEMKRAQAGASEGDAASMQHLSSIRAKQFTDTFVSLKDAMLSTKSGEIQGHQMQAAQGILSAVGMPMASAGVGAVSQVWQQLENMQKEAKTENQKLAKFSGPMAIVQSRAEYKKALRDMDRGNKRAEQASMEELMESQAQAEEEKLEDEQYKRQRALSHGTSFTKWAAARRKSNELAGIDWASDISQEDFAWEAQGAERGEREKYAERVKKANGLMIAVPGFVAKGEIIDNNSPNPNSWNTQQYSKANDKFDKYGRPKRLR